MADEVMSTGRVIARPELVNPVVKFQRILVATDFSKGARAGLDFALAIARGFQSQVFLVHVIPTGALQYVSPEGTEDIVRQARQFAEQEMQRLVADSGCAGQAQPVIVSGSTVWPLLQEFI